MEIYKDSKIGIWGFGVVGKSLLNYFTVHDYGNLYVYDQQNLLANGLKFRDGVSFTQDLNFFLNSCDFIFPSPGVDLDLYDLYKNKFVSELDLFAQNWPNKIIAITGTLGKTTLTTLLASVFNHSGIKTVAAGNVGLAMCDVLEQEYNQVILELSSFQLEQMYSFAPDFAIWTNLYPNHLDRHKTLRRYALAKMKMFLQQTSEQVALIPIGLLVDLKDLGLLERFVLKSRVYFFGQFHELDLLDKLKSELEFKVAGIFFKQGDEIKLIAGNDQIVVVNLIDFRAVDTYEMNVLILVAVGYLSKIELPRNLIFQAVAHRVERFHTNTQGVVFYNDSKSTVPQATLAAVHKLRGKSIILFLGGLDKGVDRADLVQNLAGIVKLVICFGGEAEKLNFLCERNNIKSAKFKDLESALDYCLMVAEPGDQVLFSPSGSSYDLFANYVERGELFKKLVLTKTT